MAARAGGAADPDLRDGRGFDVAVAELPGNRRLIVIPEPYDERSVSQIVENSFIEFERLKQRQIVIRQVGLLTLGVLTFLLIFASTWIAFYVARGITQPIKALAQGAEEIARGNLGHRVDVLAEDELALLVSTFNDMSAKLESNSLELEQRRRYIETVLETLPTGVISFDAQNRVSTINRSAINILRLTEVSQGAELQSTVQNTEDAEVLLRTLARARRVGHASDQLKLTGLAAVNGGHPDEEVTVALTATRFPSDAGVVLVIEDLSDLISAQRASAWQEVARRMAHEIKNPLTPIQLSAERIAKRFVNIKPGENGDGSRDKGPVGKMVQESTATILREVASLKSMVDEFSRFARLPDLVLDRGDINSVIAEAVSVFAGTVDEISIETDTAENLPRVFIDAEQLKRVFINLIRNAVEAFDETAGLARIVITTRFDHARDLIVAEVADNARGFSPGDLQKLFQPYFSTKERGTGLGLAIVHRIIVDHRAKIRAVNNSPKGAKFIIEIPVNP
jgi:two-component system, NtrC family, nitrogen regulation sensor histidine kinase NtrY